jgi:hypothetical protein
MNQWKKVTTFFVTPSRTSANPIQFVSANFDTWNNLEGWYTAYNNNKWLQKNGNESTFFGTYGPGSDWKSICM